MKKALLLLLMAVSSALAQTPGTVNLVAKGPTGQYTYLQLDPVGKLYTVAGYSGGVPAATVQGNIPPSALVLMGPNGFVYANADAYGNLLVNYTGSLTNANIIQNVNVSPLPPTSGQVMAFNGTVWIPTTLGSGTGTVTSITASSPLTGGTIITSGTIGCSTCALNTLTLAQFASTSSAQLAGLINDETGSGAAVFATNAVLVTPNLGTPSAINLTNATALPASSITGNLSTTNFNSGTNADNSHYWRGDGTWATVTATAAFSTLTGGTSTNAYVIGTGGSMTYTSTGTINASSLGGTAAASFPTTSSNLSVFAATTSAQLAGVVSDETGTGKLVFSTNPSLSGVVAIGLSGTAGSVVFGNATSGTVTLQTVTGALGSVTASLPANSGTLAELNLAQTWSAVQTIAASNGLVLSAITGTQCLQVVSGVVTGTGSACGSGTGSNSWVNITAGANAATGAFSTAGPWTFSAAGASSSSGVIITGAPYTAGSGTTNFPQLYVNAGSAVSSFSTAGTMFAVNTPSGFNGNLFDAHINGGSSVFKVSYTGAVTAASFTGTFNSNTYPAAASFASGGILYASNTSTIASSSTLTQYGVVIGGGSGAAPTTITSTNVNQALFASAGAPGFRAIGIADWGSSDYSADTGSVNAMVATLSPAATSYFMGMLVAVTPTNTNTSTTPTLNVNGLGAKTITKNGQAALSAGDITTNSIAFFIYDGTYFELQNAATNSFASPTFTGIISFNGVNYNVSSSPTSVATLNGGISSSATSLTLNSVTGYPSCSNLAPCYAYVGTNTFTGEIVQYSTISGTTVTLTGRGMFGTTAQAQSNTGQFMLITFLQADTLTSLPIVMHVANGSTFYYPTLSTLSTAGYGTLLKNYFGLATFGSGFGVYNSINVTSDGGGGFDMSCGGGGPTLCQYMTNNGFLTTAGNRIQLTTDQSLTNTTLSSGATNLVLPTIAAYATRSVAARCVIAWSQSTGVSTVQFGIGMTNPVSATTMNIINLVSNSTYSAPTYTTITNSTTVTAVSPSITPGASGTVYTDELDFGLNTGNPGAGIVVTIYAATGNASDAVVIKSGSYCELQL
jgi:hypothetical protein